ncbi:hypothetical protein I5M32_06615 [Pedobacter sp. SD-b]|uniref:Uncharacterized protein n=1 Tax=Pedobacter segetis TaxID=2793069 RepID=A0ABS1BJW9_9SPHI|nr:hypothetical protein [Pedobacter segetis]MBK0382631.1 hypothetical protein [Pedobacter segetis]
MKTLKSYYLFGMFIILAAHTVILGTMLANEKKVKASEDNKNNNVFYPKNSIKLYPSNDRYTDSLLKRHQVFVKEFVLK